MVLTMRFPWTRGVCPLSRVNAKLLQWMDAFIDNINLSEVVLGSMAGFLLFVCLAVLWEEEMGGNQHQLRPLMTSLFLLPKTALAISFHQLGKMGLTMSGIQLFTNLAAVVSVLLVVWALTLLHNCVKGLARLRGRSTSAEYCSSLLNFLHLSALSRKFFPVSMEASKPIEEDLSIESEYCFIGQQLIKIFNLLTLGQDITSINDGVSGPILSKSPKSQLDQYRQALATRTSHLLYNLQLLQDDARLALSLSEDTKANVSPPKTIKTTADVSTVTETPSGRIVSVGANASSTNEPEGLSIEEAVISSSSELEEVGDNGNPVRHLAATSKVMPKKNRKRMGRRHDVLSNSVYDWKQLLEEMHLSTLRFYDFLDEWHRELKLSQEVRSALNSSCNVQTSTKIAAATVETQPPNNKQCENSEETKQETSEDPTWWSSWWAMTTYLN